MPDPTAHHFTFDGLLVDVVLPQTCLRVSDGALEREYAWHLRVHQIFEEGMA